MRDEQAVTTSLEVAKVFGKEHRNVLRDIDKLKKDVLNFEQMFQEGQEPDSYGRARRVVYMNRDGFTLLAMGFTGDKALQFKVKYIEAFNKMEQAIREAYLPQTPEEQLRLTMKVTNRLVGRVDKVEKDVKHILDTTQVDDQQRHQLLKERTARVIEACGGKDSNYYQTKKAKKVFAEFGRDFKNAFDIPRYDCLKKKFFEDAIDFTKKWYPSFVLQREIQNVNAQTRLDLGDD